MYIMDVNAGLLDKGANMTTGDEMNMIELLIGLIFLSTLIYLVVAVHYKHRLTKYFLKPGTMVLIITLAIYGSQFETTFSKWLIIGLIFSVIGDIFLMLADKWFVHGLISFFIAHVFYIVGLYGLVTFEWSNSLLPGIVLLIVAILFFAYLYTAVKKEGGIGLNIAVALYIAIISVMVWLAILTGDKVLIVAALLFYISDAVLAIDKFRRRFGVAEHIIMSTYFLAQLLFSLSITPIFI